MSTLPPELSCLHRLRILYLHDAFFPVAPPPEEWAPLAALPSLAFLSISANGLQSLPPVVEQLTSLQV